MAGNLFPLNSDLKKSSLKVYSGQPVTETLTNGFFTVNHNWTVKYWNKAAEKLLRVEAADIVGRNLWEKFAGTIPLEFYAIYHKAFLTDIPVHFEEYWGEMGAWFDVVTYYSEDTLSVSFKSSNQPHAEYPEDPVQRMKTLTELYRFVTEITNDCLWEWNLVKKEMFWIDGGHKRVLGYQIENSLIPQAFWENCIHPEDRERVLSRLKAVILDNNGSVWEEEYRFKKANGQYAFVHDRGHIVYGEDGFAARVIGATQDITEKVLLENKLTAERRSRTRAITDAVVTAQEKQRAEIGKELHDNLNQTLAVAKLYIQMGGKQDIKRQDYLDKSSELVTQVIEEIRKISKTLLIPGTHILGLFDNIKNLLYDLSQVHPVKIKFYHAGIDETVLKEKLQLAIFRMVQEQVTNILNHSKATHAAINLTREANNITLFISDNGVGCDMVNEINGVGMINIRARADLFDGHVTIASKPGDGFELTVILPVGPPVAHDGQPQV